MSNASEIGCTSASAIREVDIAALGPVAFNESRLASRVRFHQAWYRAAVLHIDSFGSTRTTTGDIPRGSILPDFAAATGMNFTSEQARAVYLQRRSRGWGLDPVRCTAYLTSSQALTLNLFGPLLTDHRWFARVLTQVLSVRIIEVLEAHLEHAPARPSQALGDRTMLDLWLLLRRSDGKTLSVAFEVKYSDRFNSRHLPVWANPKYLELATRRPHPTWDWDNPITRSRTVNQLLRCHALTMLFGEAAAATTEHLLVIHHPADTDAPIVTREYASTVPHDPVAHLDLTAFLDAMRSTSDGSDQEDHVEQLRMRYVAHELSDPLWNERQ
ncbi:PGN_0703 family putative restriction endonuclease [Rhodococcoides fascians]|uniref:PGN_0703 family putative restriction endonuclease n=1 Tax=Rhodococcoides fascians TaxID=1828 RepID=UPI00055D5BC5|nr:hypothetical protein [Rhodococcus fascians]